MTTPIPEEHKVTYNFLGRSGIKVSNISLGCATFGDVTWGWPEQTNEEASHQIINRYVEWGGNFLDTSNNYALGVSESILGTWLERQPRDKFVIATKCRFNMGTDQNVNNVGLSRRHITASIDGTLKRLHTDFVDLYQIHGWDDGTPIEETLRALDDLFRVGKVRYVGLSNVTGWQLQKIVDLSERYSLNSIVSLQQQYSLTSRDSELEVFQVCKSNGIAVLPWSPLKGQPRDKFVIATKCRQNMGTSQNVNNVGLSRRHITASIDGSLKRLRTDFVDLYQIHAWDDGTPIEETLRALDDLVRVGKVRYVGLSNVTGWQLQKIVDLSERYGLNSIVSLQQQYSLASRDSELEVFQVCKSNGIAVLPWSPLKGGLLTGKVKRGVKPTEGRLGSVAAATAIPMQAAPHWSTFDDKTFDIIETVEAIAKKRGRSIPQVALRWLLQRDIVPSVIIGAKTLAQLDDNMLAANGWSLTREEMKQLDNVSTPNLPYPYAMVFGMNADRVNPRANDFYVKSVAD